MFKTLLAIGVCAFGLTSAFADDAKAKDFAKDISPLLNESKLSFAERALCADTVEAQIESGGFFNMDGGTKYVGAPQSFSINWNLDDIGNEGWRRGNTQFRFTTLEMPLLTGPESHFVGFAAGPQYQFVQPGSNWVPFIGARVGFGFTDSRDPILGGQGQDYCFMFMVTPGVRYYFSEHWSVALQANYLHVSNGGLSEPSRKNDGWNLVGPQASLIYTF